MGKLIDKLKGGDLRSIGKADEVVSEIIKNPPLFGEVFEGMLDENPVIRMRSADAIEKVSSKYPEFLQPYKKKLIDEVSQIEQKEVRWHVAQMLSYIKINADERDKIIAILISYLKDKSNIVKVFSLQTLSELAMKDKSIKPLVIKIIKSVMKNGSPAILSRGKKLLPKLE